MLTTKLRSTGVEVLAKDYKGMVLPVTFANQMQAEAAALRVGGQVHKPITSRPWFVRVDCKADYIQIAADAIGKAKGQA